MLFKRLFAIALATAVGILLPIAASALHYQTFTFTDRRGNAVKNGDVEVFITGTSVEANIYDRDGNALTQPLTTNSFGLVRFSAENGIYDIQLSGDAIASRTLEQVQFWDYRYATSSSQLNVMSFGAYPDDMLDDAPGIQAAIDEAEAIGGTTVFFPTGHYIINTTITVQEHGIILAGESMGSTETEDYGTVLDFQLNNATDSGIIAGVPMVKYLQHFGMRDMSLRSDSYKCGHLLVLDSCYQAIIENVGFYHQEVSGDGYAALLCGASGNQKSSKNVIQNCRFFCAKTKDPSTAAYGYGIWMRCTGTKWNTANQIRSCFINYTSTDDTGFSVFLDGTPGSGGYGSASTHLSDLRIDVLGNSGIYNNAGASTFLGVDLDSGWTGTPDTLFVNGVLADRGFFIGRIDGDLLNEDIDPARRLFILPSLPQIFNVQHFGAKGNETNDDTDAIKKALYAAQTVHGAVRGGGQVHFPLGTYRITSPLHVWSDGVSLTGESVGTGTWKDGSVIWPQFEPDDGFHPDSMAIYVHDADHFKMDNLSVMCSDSLVTDLLVLDNTLNAIIQNSNFYLDRAYQDSAAAIIVQQTGASGDSRYNMFNNLSIWSPQHKNDGSGVAYDDAISFGIWVRSAGSNHAQSNMFSNIHVFSGSVLNDGAGVLLSGRDSGEVNGCVQNVFSNIQVKTNGSKGYIINSKENSFLNCNVIGSSSDSLIVVGPAASKIQFIGRCNGEVDIDGSIAPPGIQTTAAANELTITTTGYLRKPWSHFHKVDTFEDAASDDLQYFGAGYTGQIVTLSPADDARTVVVKAAGDFALNTVAGDFSMDNKYDKIMLVFDGSQWSEISRSDNGI